ncbi:hypothetical protein [Brevibacillus daliensis]|uniref:hypothetical protein n=1 Tax=Brevibacillus daliensis TaxID=2892995 RepID=UPI001E3A9882|nr:hypothetical protein [Brevibacillus daliensis]
MYYENSTAANTIPTLNNLVNENSKKIAPYYVTIFTTKLPAFWINIYKIRQSSPVRVNIPKPTGLRMPDGNEVAANSQWIPGGYTGGGIPEATIDQVPLDKLIVTEILK